MNQSRFFVTAALLLWFATGLQQGVAFHLSLFGALPDYIFVTVCLLGLLTDTRNALILGFAAGFAEGAIVGANMWQLILTRMVACWLCAFLVESRFQRNFGTAAVVTLGATILCNVLFMIIALQSNIGTVLKATIITALYNGVLALMAYVPVERATGIRSQQL